MNRTDRPDNANVTSVYLPAGAKEAAASLAARSRTSFSALVLAALYNGHLHRAAEELALLAARPIEECPPVLRNAVERMQAAA